MADPNVKWRYLTKEEKEALREEFKLLHEEDMQIDLDPDEVIDWLNLDLDKAIKLCGRMNVGDNEKDGLKLPSSAYQKVD